MKSGVVVLHFDGVFYPLYDPHNPLLVFKKHKQPHEGTDVYYKVETLETVSRNYALQGNALQVDEFAKGRAFFDRLPKLTC